MILYLTYIPIIRINFGVMISTEGRVGFCSSSRILLFNEVDKGRVRSLVLLRIR